MSFHASQIPEIPYPEKEANIAFGEQDLNRVTQGNTSLEEAKQKQRATRQYAS